MNLFLQTVAQFDGEGEGVLKTNARNRLGVCYQLNGVIFV